MYFKKHKGITSQKQYVYLSMNDGTGRTKKIAITKGDSFTLPTETPFQMAPGSTFLGWSTTVFGPVITQSSIQVDGNTMLFARYTVTLTFNPANGSGDVYSLVVEQTKEYTLPTGTTFTAPTGKTFDGWSYMNEGAKIEELTIPVLTSLTLYANWASGYEGWIQILNYSTPQSIGSKDDIFKYNDSSKLYAFTNANDTQTYVYNGFELTGIEVAEVKNEGALPKIAPSNVVYHRTGDDTYWHYEYDIVKSINGWPVREDDAVWENINILSVDIPKIGNNTYEVYYQQEDNRQYYYDYLTEKWEVQSTESPELAAYDTILAQDLFRVEKPEYLPDKLYKIEKTVGNNYYYTWGRLIDAPYHRPPRPKIDPTIYWIITKEDKYLYIAAHPIVYDSTDIKYSGNFPSDYAPEMVAGTGPWKDYSTEVQYIDFLETIAPVSLHNWFQLFTNLKNIYHLERLKTDYVTTLYGAFQFCSHCFEPDTLDFTSFDTSSLKIIRSFISNRHAPQYQASMNIKEIDLSSWDTSKLENARWAFSESVSDSVLKHIYVGDKWDLSNVTDDTAMVGNCTGLPHYNSSYTGKTRCVIDNGSNNGYFERKCVVKLDPNGGNGNVITKYIKKNDVLTLPPNPFFLSQGHIFLGWSKTQDKTGIITTETITITEDTTLYAILGTIEDT